MAAASDVAARDDFSSWGYRKTGNTWEDVFFRLSGKMFLYFRDDQQKVPLGYMDQASIQRTEYMGAEGHVQVVKLFVTSGNWRVIGLSSRKLAEDWRQMLSTSVLSRVSSALLAPKRAVLLAAPDVVMARSDEPDEVQVEAFGEDDEEGARLEVRGGDDDDLDSVTTTVVMEVPDMMMMMMGPNDGDHDYDETAVPVFVGERGDVHVLSQVQEALAVYDSQEPAPDGQDDAAGQDTVSLSELQTTMEEMLGDLLDDICALLCVVWTARC